MTQADPSTDQLAQVNAGALYRSVVRAMAEGVVIYDAAGRIIDVNPSAERVLGLTREQLIGSSAGDPRWRVVRPDGSPATADDIPSTITRRTRRPCRGHRLGVQRSDGGLSWILLNTEGVVDASGNLQLVVVTFTDITESVLANAALL